MVMSRFTHVALLGSIGLALGLASVPAAADTVAFTGLNARENSLYAYAGGVTALNGNLGMDGFLLRGVVGYGDYSYQAGTTVDGELWQFDATVGYQVYSDSVRLSAYAGYNYQDHSLSPNDPGNSTRGGHSGFIGQLELETLQSQAYYLSGMGSYSTANDSYWTRGRAGFRMGDFVLGGEAVFDGHNEYNARRFGGFAMIQTMMGFSIDVAIGHSHASGSQGGDGVYGSAGISVVF